MSGYSRLIELVARSAVSKDPDRQFVAVRGDMPPGELERFEIDGQPWEAHSVSSTLQARRVMAYAGKDGRRVLVTSIREDELGPEVMARVTQNRVHSVEPWVLVRELFGARQIDPRVTEQSWMARALLHLQPAGGYPRSGSGILDLDTAWTALSRALGFGSEPSLEEWVVACVEDRLQERWSGLELPMQEGLARRIEELHGDAGAALVELLRRGHAASIVPVGLVCVSVSAAPEGRARTEAEVRLEMTYGLRSGAAELGGVVIRWCRRELEEGRSAALESVFSEAQGIAEACGATELLATSNVLPQGLEARLNELAATLTALVEGPQNTHLQAEVERAGRLALDHHLIGRTPRFEPERERVEGALRLSRWLGTASKEPSSLQAAASAYRDGGAWVDRVRYRLLRGTAGSPWSRALGRLAGLARERREQDSSRFARALQRVTAGREEAGGGLLLEDVYRDVVAPLADRLPVLVVVLDGMSQAIFQQLAESIAKRTSLRRMVRGSAQSWPPVLAPLPTVTQVARTSLLCGELTRGEANVEKPGARALAQELGWSTPSDRPILFHKGALQESGGGLSSEVMEALEGPARVVTVVLNAIDDALPKGEQLDLRWGLESLRELEALVSSAEVDRRAVVLTADHGHVVELWESEGDADHPNEKGERWRTPGRPVEERELEFQGRRVLLPEPGGPVVLPWSESLRYSGRHAGYHGGASPQEVVVPLGVFVPEAEVENLARVGWDDELVRQPWWWTEPRPPEGDVAEVEPSEPEPVAAPRPRRPEPEGQARMFEEPAEKAEPAAPRTPAWIEALFESDVYAGQLRSARALRPNTENIRSFLTEIERMGDQATFDGLRTRMGLSSIRFSSLVRLVARILNVDGYGVLEVDDATRTIRLDRVMLHQQFGLEAPQ